MVNLKQIAEGNLVLMVMVGSQLYGTATENSDKDYIGVCIPPKDFVLGTHRFEQYDERTNPSNSERRNTKSDSDITIYTLQKYFKLLAENNPNIVETVFAPSNCVMFCNELGREILNSKHMFLSKQAYHKFRGYASSEKKKVLCKESTGKYGYDTKHAAHLIRLLLFGTELLHTGCLQLPTEWRNCLVAIKNGEWQLSAIIDKINYLEKSLDENFKHSWLPEEPNMDAINKLQISLFERHWYGYAKKQIGK